jgi:alpha-L-fucosidase 2
MEQRFWAGARLIFILMSAAALCLATRAAESKFKLTYDKPAARIGAMVFGGVEDERLQINEGTLWGGNPHDYANPDTHAQLDQIRELILAGKVDEAERLSAEFR